MGQAAGTAAALALANSQGTRDISLAQLQARLLAAGAILEAPAATEVDVGNPDW